LVKVVKENYSKIKDIAIFLESSSEFPFISMIDMNRFIKKCKLIDAKINQGLLDTLFREICTS